MLSLFLSQCKVSFCSTNNIMTVRFVANVSKIAFDMTLLITALPQAPYPSIRECPLNATGQPDGQSCNLRTISPTNITCSVSGYFPTIDLYFQRNHSTRIETSEISEWNNSDGTKNKTITIIAEPSDVPYSCVAGDIPGSRDPDQVANIFIFGPMEETTTAGTTTIPPEETTTAGTTTIPPEETTTAGTTTIPPEETTTAGTTTIPRTERVRLISMYYNNLHLKNYKNYGRISMIDNDTNNNKNCKCNDASK